MTYVTTRIALEAFAYDPYDFRPEWWINMCQQGKAWEYKETKDAPAYAEVNNQRAEIGDKIYLDETGHVGVLTASRFSKMTKPLNPEREAAAMFKERLEDAKYKFTNELTKNVGKIQEGYKPSVIERGSDE